MTNIIKKYFGKPPAEVKELASKLSKDNVTVTETDKTVSAEIKISINDFTDMKPEQFLAAYRAEEAARATTAAAVANMAEKYPGKKVSVKMVIDEAVTIEGSHTAKGKVVTRLRTDVEGDKYDEYYKVLDETVKARLEKD